MEIDREVLRDMIRSEASTILGELFRDLVLPLHRQNSKTNAEIKRQQEEDSRKLDEVIAFMHRTQGGATVVKSGFSAADKVIGFILAILLFIAGHFWK